MPEPTLGDRLLKILRNHNGPVPTAVLAAQVGKPSAATFASLQALAKRGHVVSSAEPGVGVTWLPTLQEPANVSFVAVGDANTQSDPEACSKAVTKAAQAAAFEIGDVVVWKATTQRKVVSDLSRLSEGVVGVVTPVFRGGILQPADLKGAPVWLRATWLELV